jgi:hypothetical protein
MTTATTTQINDDPESESAAPPTLALIAVGVAVVTMAPPARVVDGWVGVFVPALLVVGEVVATPVDGTAVAPIASGERVVGRDVGE